MKIDIGVVCMPQKVELEKINITDDIEKLPEFDKWLTDWVEY